jgi:hypothetical protein
VIFQFLLIASASVITPTVDQTADVAVVAQFLNLVRAQKIDNSNDEVSLKNLDDKLNSSALAFANYANGCTLSEISTIKNGLPLNVEWSCHHPEANRHANIWVEDGKITRIQWGRRPVVKLAPVNSSNGADQ